MINRMGSLLEQSDARYPVSDDLDEQLQFCADHGWTDGLPVVPPTTKRVEAMLSYFDGPVDTCLANIPPRNSVATPVILAANATMAGCLPEYFPIVVLAVQAMCDSAFNLYAVQTTTHSSAPLVIVNGPIARQLGIDCAHMAFGPGARANASIGRAIRLALMNIGGAIPGVSDMSTYGSPAKFSFCIAENEANNPWEPLHVERGYPPESSTVSVFACEAPHNVSDHASFSARGILTTVAGTSATTGANSVYHPLAEPLILLSPEHAATIHKDGFSKDDIRQFLFEHARIALDRFSAENIDQRIRLKHAELFDRDGAKMMVPVATAPERFMIAVVGGAGKHSSFLPSFGNTSSVTRVLRNSSGEIVKSIEDLRHKGSTEI